MDAGLDALERAVRAIEVGGGAAEVAANDALVAMLLADQSVARAVPADAGSSATASASSSSAGSTRSADSAAPLDGTLAARVFRGETRSGSAPRRWLRARGAEAEAEAETPTSP